MAVKKGTAKQKHVKYLSTYLVQLRNEDTRTKQKTLGGGYFRLATGNEMHLLSYAFWVKDENKKYTKSRSMFHDLLTVIRLADRRTSPHRLRKPAHISESNQKDSRN